jgi:hypothetical protein
MREQYRFFGAARLVYAHFEEDDLGENVLPSARLSDLVA